MGFISPFLSDKYQVEEIDLTNGDLIQLSSTAYELIDAVNIFRNDHGLAPYVIEAGLMSKAQTHSEYQASILDHTHTRADGTGPEHHGISSENIGGGMNVSANDLVYRQWADYWHTHTMIGYTLGNVGAGVVEIDGLFFYTLIVVNTGEFLDLSENENVPPPQAITPTEDVLAEVYTAEPSADASITHLVEAGQNPWTIATAYNITVAQLVALNGLDPDNPTIWVGQVLVIREAFTPTISPTVTLTPTVPTRTPRPTFTPRPPTTTPTETITPTATTKPLIPGVPPMKEIFTLRTIGYIVIIFSGLGLLYVAITGFLIKK
ncbi:MAG: LysM peptidoglycan-binding domain-containing protein [Anaerolineaceae bacterium]|nr:LysM peptidoglycan-binding domain-containing protein [Anaerolineaceae bacterium]